MLLLQDHFPADILLLISAHLGPQDKKNLCLVSRYFHFVFTPITLRNVRVLFCEEHTTVTSSNERLWTCLRKLPNLYQHAQSLRVRINGNYLREHDTRDLLPALSKTLTCLTSLKSLDVHLECGNTPERIELIVEYQAQIIKSTLRATGDRLECLVVTAGPVLDPRIFPTSLSQIRGLKTLRIDQGQPRLDLGRVRDGNPCDCDRSWVNKTLKPLICANPGLETLEIVKPCRKCGLEANDILSASLSNLRLLTISALENSSVSIHRAGLCNLRHLTIQATYGRFDVDAFWKALAATQTPLETLVSHHVSLSMLDYLASFSGLRSLSILEIMSIRECHSPEVLSTFTEHVLPSHAQTLERLVIGYQDGVGTLSGWDFDPSVWAPALKQLSALEYLAIYPHIDPPLPTIFDPMRVTPHVITAYQTLLDFARTLPSLKTLGICHLQSLEGEVDYLLHKKVVPELMTRSRNPKVWAYDTGRTNFALYIKGRGWAHAYQHNPWVVSGSP